MKNDRRINRTKKLLTNAFIALLLEKNLNEITVKELCEKADINRGTFYLHYQDIYDLKQQLENDIHKQLNDIMDSLPDTLNTDNTQKMFLYLFAFFENNRQLLKAFLGPNGDISFQKKTQTLFRERYLNILLRDTKVGNITNIDYSYNFIASGFTALIETWLNEETPPSLEEMAKLTNKIVFDGLLSIFSNL